MVSYRPGKNHQNFNQNLLVAANLMGFAAQWLTEWYAYDETIDAKLGTKVR